MYISLQELKKFTNKILRIKAALRKQATNFITSDILLGVS